MSPSDDTFLSGATDDTVRLWDLRTQNAQVICYLYGSALDDSTRLILL